MRAHSVVLISSLCLGLSACLNPAFETPSAPLQCATDVDCPGGYFCQEASLLCVDAFGDITPPGVVSAQIEGGATSTVLANRRFELQLVVTEALSSLRVSTGDRFELLDMPPWKSVDDQGRVTYTLRPRAPEEVGTHRLRVSLRDLSYNGANGIELADVEVVAPPP